MKLNIANCIKQYQTVTIVIMNCQSENTATNNEQSTKMSQVHKRLQLVIIFHIMDYM